MMGGATTDKWSRLIVVFAAVFLLFPIRGMAAALDDPSEQVASSSFTAKAGHETIRFRDTLKTPAQRSQFRTALKMAPSTFVCESFKTDGRTYAGCTRLRFNDSMRRVLQLGFVQKDAFLQKQLRRLFLLSRPFNLSGDLMVHYREVPAGLAIEYEISELYIWGRRASDRLIREVLKANGVGK